MDSAVQVRDFADAAPAPKRRPFVEDKWALQPTIQQHSASSDDSTPLTPFYDCRIAFAIDISQSTRGIVLSEECAFIENFAHGLSPESKESVRVVPWDEIAHKTIKVEELGRIDPGGRTDPNVLLRSREHIDLLQACHLWFLLTDGEIVPNTVRRFAFSINSRSLHGTACVIVIFEKRPAKPILCNVSVGISVFAVTPNCMFIFHDIDSHIAYILQYKGCFSILILENMGQIKLDNTTQWYEIPRLHYPDLFDIQIPAPTKLEVNQIQLKEGEKIDLEDLYRGRISKAVEDEILSSDENLKSVILIATTRGQNREIHAWITARRDTFIDLVNMPRPDINGKAAALVKEAIQYLQRKGARDTELGFGKTSTLRQIHILNLKAFKDSISIRGQQVTYRSTVVDDSLTRLDLIERLGPSSAECISPVSPGRYQSVEASRSIDQGPSSKLLYPKGYILDNFGSLMPSNSYTSTLGCQLCKGSLLHFAIMLKRAPEGNITASFPPIQSQTEVSYPFALGNFRETDIISNLVCCAPCAVLAVEYGHSPNHETLLGALVLGHRISAASDINRNAWLYNLDKALEGRFTQDNLLQILLAIMYSTKGQLPSPHSELASSLGNACKTLQAEIQIPYETGNHHWTGCISDVFLHYLSIGIASPGCDFLNHPVDSFVLMTRAAVRVERNQRVMAMFYRLTLHIIEHSHSLQDTDSGLIAAEFYGRLRSRLPQMEDSDQIFGDIPINEILNWQTLLPFLFDLLCEKHLVEREALKCFRGAEVIFNEIETKCGMATCLFICLFHVVNTRLKEPRQILHWFCTRPEMVKFFHMPWEIDEPECRSIWDSLT